MEENTLNIFQSSHSLLCLSLTTSGTTLSVCNTENNNTGTQPVASRRACASNFDRPLQSVARARTTHGGRDTTMEDVTAHVEGVRIWRPSCWTPHYISHLHGRSGTSAPSKRRENQCSLTYTWHSSDLPAAPGPREGMPAPDSGRRGRAPGLRPSLVPRRSWPPSLPCSR